MQTFTFESGRPCAGDWKRVGSQCNFTVKNYGCNVTTTTISEEHNVLAKQRIATNGLEHKITVLLSVYRALTGKYDKIVSIVMLEAVGAQYLPVYFNRYYKLLKKEGIHALRV